VTNESILNFLNDSLQEIVILMSAIILMIFFWTLNTFFLSVKFHQKITPHDVMKLK